MKVFDAANQYCKESDWKTIAGLKLCLLSLGIACGMCVPDKAKKTTARICGLIYGFTLLPLLEKYIDILRR